MLGLGLGLNKSKQPTKKLLSNIIVTSDDFVIVTSDDFIIKTKGDES